jgi:hypothetical protein
METTWGALMKDAKVAAEPVPEGEHPVKITDCQATNASTGKLMFKLVAEILEGPAAKRKVYGNLVLSPENSTALAMFFKNMTAIGLGDEFFAQEPNPDQVARNCIGRQARVVIKHREWLGNKRGDIDRWVPALGGGLGGPIAPGTVVGPAGPPLPTANSSPTPVPTVGAGPTIGAGPVAPSDAPPPLPI